MSWWFFALIMISSYKANRTSFLTVSRFDELLINSVDDLAQQKDINYGCLWHGATFDYFRVRNELALHQQTSIVLSLVFRITLCFLLDWGFVVVVPFAFWSRLFLNFHLIC
jgi:hypothetical protein